MPNYKVDIGMWISVHANSETEAFSIAHSYVADRHDNPPEDIAEVDGEVIGVEEE